MNDIDFLKKKGYVFKKNFFDEDEIKKLKSLSNYLHTNSGTKVVNHLHNNKKAWSLLVNSKIINFLKKFYDTDKVFYLYNSHYVTQKRDEKVDNAWHRDNACRVFGIGPDWKNDYNIIRVAIYLNDETKNDENGLNLVVKSHKGKKLVCFIIRKLRQNFKRIYFNKIFRYFFDRFIGKKIIAKTGDCLFFYASMYHSAIRSKKSGEPRKAFFLTYGSDNDHADNFLNYYIHHHPNDHTFDCKKNNKKEFINYLNNNELFEKLTSDKKTIEGFTI